MEHKESEELLLSVFGVALLIIIISSITYAVFSYTSKSDTVNLITTGAIKMSYIESDTNIISINNAIPISDYIGKVQEEYFDFSLSSLITGIMTINYDIVAKNVLCDNELSYNDVKVYLEKKVGGQYVEVLEPSVYSKDTDKGMLLHSDSFINSYNKSSSFVDYYRFRMWMNENSFLSDKSQCFIVKIDVYAQT